SNQGGEVGATPSSGSRSTGASGQLLARAHACSGGRWSPKQAEGARRTTKVRGRRGRGRLSAGLYNSYLPGRGDTFGSSLSGVGSAPRPWIQSWVGWRRMAEMVLLGGSNRRMGSEREDGSEFGRGGGRPASRIPIDGRERRNVVRFELKEEQMERKEFSIEVLQKTLKFIPGEIDFLFAFPGKTTFEVVFKTRYLYDKCVRTVEREKEVNLILDKFLIVPLSDRLDKKVNVIMYTEKVKIQDISTWLLQYCDVKTSMQMTDDDGIKNGLYKFDIILKKERDTDRVIHLPPVIQIGAVRGHVFYPGQPQVCRRCGKEGHKVLECIVVKCRNCKEEGHSTRECRKQIICNLCGQEAHAFKDCPVSYANIVKVNKTDKHGVGHKESGGS
uniref:CCHC-type domain-containing protein n=1 Tax=Erpetoichthys calabaricus TaxID=27687 RepID=A0A8C4XBX0_ERPCA